MVAVVSGNGLGLFNSSLTQLGSALGGQAGIGQSRDSQYLNIATGNLLLTGWDESLFGRGLSTGLVRTYNSAGSFGETGADGWQTGYERTVHLASGTLNTAGSIVERATADGGVQAFAWDAARNAYVLTAGDGAHDTITLSGTGVDARWLWTEGSSQTQETYAAGLTPTAAGRLERIVDLSTGAGYELGYNTDNQLTTITGANGETLEFTYASATGPLVAVSTRERDAAGVLVLKGQVTYGYDAANRLSWVQTDLTPDVDTDNTWDSATLANNDGKRFRTSYTYADATSLRITNVSTSDGVSISYSYDGSGRVAAITQGSAADGSAQTLTYTYNAGATDVTDSAGRTWTCQYDANEQLTAVLAPAVNGQQQITSYSYDADGNVMRISQAAYAGAAATQDTVFAYDANGNVTLQRDRLGNTVERTYNSANRVLTETTYSTPDADGLDPDFTGTSNLPAGALVTRYVYDASNLNQLRFVINAAGEVSENQYVASGTASGQLSVSRRFLGAAYDLSGLGATAVPTLAQMSAWLVGKEGQTSRSEVSYDAQGRITQTVAYATVASDGSGELDAAAAITSYTYDAQGLLRQKIAVYGASRTLGGAAPTGSAVTDYLYDGLGRLLGVVSRDVATAINDDATTVSTTYSYLDAANQLQVTLDSGAVRIEARNQAGLLVAVSESNAVSGATVTRNTQNFYDADGRLRATQDASGARSYFFYDAAGRLTATVDATGAVTETRYDDIGRAVHTIGYATRVDTSTWLVGGVVSKDALVLADTAPALAANEVWVDTDAATDRNAFRSYDAAGRLATETNATGLVTSYAYDGASRLLSATVSQPNDATVIPRVTRYFHDAAGRQIGTLDAAGYLTESLFDAGGRLIQTVRYATLTNSAYWANGTLAELRPLTAGADQSTRYFYDARGQQLGVLNAEGYLTEFVTDEAGNQRAVKAYARQLTGLTGTETFTALRSAALTGAPSEAARLTERSFNALGQVTTDRSSTLDSAGSVLGETTVTRYSYDEAGRLVRTESAAGTSDVRDNFARYDVFGQLIGELSGQQAAEATATLAPGTLLTDPLGEAQLDALYSTYGTTHSYDLRGQRIESIDAKGTDLLNPQDNKTWYFYDANGRNTFTVRGVADANGLSNALGEVTETRYSAFGQVTDSLTYSGRIAIGGTQLRADAQSAINVLTYVAASDTRRTFGYDQRGLLVSATDAEGGVTQSSYTAFGQLAQVQRGVGTAALTTTQFSYDARGLQIGRSDAVNTALVRSVSQTVDAFGRVTSDTDALGTVTTHAYDRLGRQLSQSRTVEGRVESVSTTYDAFDRTLTQTNALGKITSYLHSDSNRSVTVTSPEGVAITTVHNRFGQTVIVSQVLADGSTATTTYSYDKNGALIASTDALGATTTYGRDVRGLLALSTDATGRQVKYTYDARGRVLSRIEDPTGLALTTTTVYDGQGRQLTVTDASGRVTTMSYDREGRLLQTAQDPSGLNLRTAYSYDALGRQVTVTEAFGTTSARTVNYGYDELGRRTSETVAPGTLNLVTSYVYDKNDNLVTRTDAGGNLTRFVYDQANRLRFSVNALGGITQTVYDAAGRATITRSYAKAANISTLGATAPATLAQVQGLITNQTLTNDAVDSVGYRVYDNDGRVRFSVDALYGVQASTYDSAGRLTGTRSYATAIVNAGLISKLKAGTAVVADFTASTLVADDARDARSFVVQDAVGRARFTVDGSGFVNELRYDAAGRVIERLAYNTSDATLLAAAKAGTATVASFASFVTANAAGARTSASVFDAAGRIAYTLTRSDATQAIVSERRYDAAGRVIGEVAYGKTIAYATGQTVAQIATALSNAGANAASAQRLTQYVHDAAGRLRFSLNDAGVVSEQSYNALGQVVATRIYGTPISTATPTEASVSAAVTGQTNVRLTSYTYDDAGRLASTKDALNKTETYGYDALGRRTTFTSKAGFTWTTVYNALGQTTEERSPAVQVARYNTAGTLVVESKSIVTRMTYDALGNLVSRTENAAAADAADARTTQYVYDARGRQIKTIFPDAYKVNTSGALVASGILPEINITYDALDRAVVQKDVRSNYSYKVYNALGQLAYDIDADGYVTAYTYNAYGEQTGLTRYAAKLNKAVSAFTGWQAGLAISLAQAQAGLVANASNDRVLTMSYDSRGNKVAVTQPTVSYVKADGTSANGTPRSEFTYDAYNNLVKESVLLDQANGVWAHTFHYFDELGQRTRSVDAEGYVTAWQYTTFGQVSEQLEFARAISTTGLTTATVPGTPVAGDAASGYDRGVLYVYDALGRKLSESVLRTYQNANGTSASAYVVTNLEYDNADHVTAMTVAGNRTETDYDALGRTTAVTEQARDVLVADWQTKLSQSNLNDLDKSTLYVSASPHTAMVYDAFGNTIKTTRSGLGERNGVVTASATDQITTTRYDRQGRAVLATDATGKLVTISYDAADNVLTQSYKLIDRDNHNSTVVSTFTYDASNRQLTQTTERTLYSGATVTEATQAVAYNAFGEITSKADTLAALSNATTSAMYEYDAAGRIVRSNAESGTYRRYGYNLAGVQVKEERDWTEAGVNKTAIYRQSVDKLGRVTQVISPAYSSDASAPVATTTVRLDRWGNVLEQIDARGYSTQMYYNDQNKLIRQLAPLVKVVSESGVESWIRPETSWRYDALGRLLAEVDANGHTHTYEYDSANRMFRSFDANTSATRVAYDALGQKLATQDARGHLTYVDYDVAGRATVQGDYLLDASGSTRTKAALQTFTLDQNGNRLTVKDALNNIQKYDYDSNGKLTRSQTAVGEVVSYVYDVQGRKTKETRGSYNLEWGYDYFGRTTSHKDMALVNFTYAYDARSGQQTSISQSGVSRTLTYYANGQVRTISEGATVYSYQYDAVGNRTLEETVTTDGDGQSVHVVTHTYYDSLNRISRVTSDDAVYNVRMLDVSYDYDAVGNRRRVVADSSYGPGAAPVSTADRAPIVIAAPDTQTLEGGVAKVWSLRASDIFRDPESTPMTYAVTKADGSALPSWLTVTYDAATGLLIFTATSGSSAAQGTTIGLKITARDLNGAGQTATANFNLSVITNHAPVVANVIPNKSAPVNLPWSFTFAANTFSDADGQTLTYSATGMPDGIAFDANTRTFSGTPTTSGSYVITVTASDGSLSVSTNFTVSTEPNDPPVLVNTIADYSITPSLTSSWSFTVPANTFSDTDSLTITQNGMPDWMSFSSATQTFSGSGKTVGSSTITVTATDLAGQSVSTSFVVTVLNADPVLVTPIADKTASVGQTWTFPVPDDTFVDPNNVTGSNHEERFNQDLSYSAALMVETTPGVWAAQALPSWLTFAAGSVVFTGTPPAAGSWTLRLSVSDGVGGSASTQFTLTAAVASNQAPTIVNPIADQTAVRTQAFSFTVPANTFADPNGDTLTYSYTKVGTSAWLNYDAPTRTFSGNTPASTGANTITIQYTATDPAGLSVTDTFVITLVAAGSNAAPVVANPIADQSAVREQAFTFTFPSTTFSDANGDTLTYSHTKLVGTANWLVFNAATRTFSGTPSSTDGNVTIRLTATDPGGLSVYEDFVITLTAPVANAAPVVANPITDQTAVRTQAFSFTVPANTFADANGDTLTYSYTKVGTSAWLNYDSATRTFSGNTPTSTGADTITIQYTATDSAGLSVTDTFVITLVAAGSNVAPTVANPIADQTAVRQEAFSFTFAANTFADANGDALTYTHAKVVGTAAWLSFNATTRTFSGTPGSFAGNVTIRVTATDPAGLSVFEDFVINVVDSTQTASSSLEASRTQMATDSTTSSMTIAPETSVATTSSPTDPGSTPNRQEAWFTYDAENRVQVVNGALNNGVIVISGYKSWSQQYDEVGNVKSKTTVVEWSGETQVAQSEYTLRGELKMAYHRTTVGASSQGVSAVYTYDAAGRLEDKVTYFAASTTRTAVVFAYDDATSEWRDWYEPVNVGGWLYAHITYTYDADGRLKTEHTDGRGKDWIDAFGEYMNQDAPQMGIRVPAEVVAEQKTNLNVLTALSTLAYTTATGASGYDSNGRLMTHRYLHLADTDSVVISHGNFITTFGHTYTAKESFLETGVSANVDNTAYRDGSTSSVYDVWGRRTSLTETTPLTDYDTELTSKRFFSYDAEGGILTRRDGQLVDGVFKQEVGGYTPNLNPTPNLLTTAQWQALTEAERVAWLGKTLNQHFVYSNGQQVGQVNEAGVINVADKLTTFKNSDTGAGLVAVNDGDTLQSIAQRVYGNSSLWYVLADANAVTDETLFTGQMLKTPQVQTNKNDSATFKPYNPAEVIGPTEPGTPYIAKPQAAGCGGIGMIIMIIVAIVVTIYTAGAATTFLGPMFAAAAGGAAATAGAIAAAGFAATVAGAFVGGVAGSIAGQVVGKALGVVDHFSLRQAVGAGITNAITAGIGEAAGLGTVSQALKGAQYAKAAALAVANSAAGYVGNRIAGVKDTHFSWRSIAAGAVASVVTSAIGNKLHLNPEFKGGVQTTGSIGKDFANGMIGGVVSLHVRRSFGFDDKVDYGQIAADAFGNALGNAVVRGMQSGGAPKPSAYEAETFGLGEDAAPVTVSQLPANPMGALNMAPQVITASGQFPASGTPSGTSTTGAPGATEAEKQAWVKQVADYAKYKGFAPPANLTYDSVVAYYNNGYSNTNADATLTQFATVKVTPERNPIARYWQDHPAQALAQIALEKRQAAALKAELASRPRTWLGHGSAAAYRQWETNQIGRDARTMGTYLLESAKGAANEVALWYGKGMDSHPISLVDGEFVHKTDKDYWVPFSEPTNAVAAAGRQAGPFIMAGLMPVQIQASEMMFGTGAARFTATATANYDAASASARFQGEFPYWGVDQLKNTSLPSGRFVVQLTHTGDGVPVSSYFTPLESIQSARLANGTIDANALNQGLQIFLGGRQAFRPYAQIYQVAEDIPLGGVASGPTTANPYFNPGQYQSLEQMYLLPEFQTNLKPVQLLDLSNLRTPMYTPIDEITNNMLRQDIH